MLVEKSFRKGQIETGRTKFKHAPPFSQRQLLLKEYSFSHTCIFTGYKFTSPGGGGIKAIQIVGEICKIKV